MGQVIREYSTGRPSREGHLKPRGDVTPIVANPEAIHMSEKSLSRTLVPVFWEVPTGPAQYLIAPQRPPLRDRVILMPMGPRLLRLPATVFGHFAQAKI